MGRVAESVEVAYLPATARDTEVARLEEPWIGDEGPMDADFRHGLGNEPLRQRGLAFDRETTVLWDEDGVQVVRARDAEPAVVALSSPVVVRERFSAPANLCRTDYLKEGVLVASRYSVATTPEGTRDA